MPSADTSRGRFILRKCSAINFGKQRGLCSRSPMLRDNFHTSFIARNQRFVKRFRASLFSSPFRNTIRTYAKKFALRHAQGERRTGDWKRRPFVVSLSNHFA